MNREAKNIYAGFASTAVVFTVYFIVVSGMYDAGHFEEPAGTALLGKAILALMGVSVFWVFNLLLAFGAIAALTEGTVRLALYRRGF